MQFQIVCFFLVLTLVQRRIAEEKSSTSKQTRASLTPDGFQGFQNRRFQIKPLAVLPAFMHEYDSPVHTVIWAELV